MDGLKDRFGRRINYIRISVTDRCNFRCIYCMPESGIDWKPMEELLTYEDIAFFLKVASELGIRRVKLTGGEPLVRKHVDNLVKLIRRIDEIDEISLTTNGTLLDVYADKLKKAGLDRVTVSLDTLSSDRFRLITRMGNLSDVMKGFDALDKTGFEGTKINTVLMKGVNDDEVIKLIEFAHSRGYDIRFIELMPTDLIDDWKRYFFSIADARKLIEKHFDIEKTSKKTNGPSVYYRLKSGYVGFITPLSKAFCAACNRIRLSSDGEIIACLGHDLRVSVRDAVKKRDEEKLGELIRYAVKIKPKEHIMLAKGIGSSMSAIGG